MIHPWLLRKFVLPQHTDHAGVMWHGFYLNWLEEARVDALAQVGLPYSDLSISGYEMPVVDLQIRYIDSLIHGDVVVLKSWLLEQKGARYPWKTTFHRANGKLCAEALVDLVLLKREESRSRVLRRAPAYISEALGDLQQGPCRENVPFT